jgi:hypothetical protein
MTIMQNGSKLGHSNYQENGQEKSTSKVGNRVGKLLSHTSSDMVYCKIPHRREWTKGIIWNSWPLKPHILCKR